MASIFKIENSKVGHFFVENAIFFCYPIFESEVFEGIRERPACFYGKIRTLMMPWRAFKASSHLACITLWANFFKGKSSL